MIMQKYEQMIRDLEDYAAQYPTRYKYKVLLLSILGYTYIYTLILLIAGLLFLLGYLLIEYRKGVSVIFKIMVPTALFGFMLIKSLWVRLERPKGFELKRKDFPKLFAFIEELQKKLKAPGVKHVLLTDDFNASVYQYPRLGLLGVYDNYLIIGLPLMQSITPDELKAVIAHEYGHIAGAHSKVSGWIYRLRMSWQNIANHLEKQEKSNLLVNLFAGWYFPYLNAYSFVLMRNHEYHADQVAVDITDNKLHGSALIRIGIAGIEMNQSFWPEIFKKADDVPEPEELPYEKSHSFFKDITMEDSQNILRSMLEEVTGLEDTHPSLKDRLKFIKQEPEVPELLLQNAAEYFLENSYDHFVKQLSFFWQKEIEDRWKDRYEEVRESREHIKELEMLHIKNELDVDELVGYARFLEEYTPTEKYKEVMQEAYDKDNNHLAASFHLGRIKLTDGDESGIPLIEKSMAGGDQYISFGCRRIYTFLISQSREEEAKPYEERYYKQVELEEKQEYERNNIFISDRFEPHGLDEKDVTDLVSQLDKVEKLKYAYLVRKKMNFSKEPLYVLGVRHRGREMKNDNNGKHPLLSRLTETIQFSGELFIVILNSNEKELEKSIQSISGSLIYGDIK